MISPEKITRDEFDEALGRYPALIESISTSKTPAKEGQGQLTLGELDEYRFEEAPTRYYKKNDLEDPKAAPTPLSHADVVKLVSWKLKHGTFRPNLLKLAESNSVEDVKETTFAAFTTYKTDSFKPTSAITKLITLRGIGPATASLLLSVHDPARVPFFSDELYQWLCRTNTTSKASIKYNLKEYEELVTASRALLDRLETDARDMEKVAFVLVKEEAASFASASASASTPAESSSSKTKAAKSTAAAETNGTTASTPKKSGRGRPKKSSAAPANNKDKSSKQPTKKEPRSSAPAPREPTDMTAERYTQLQEIAERARAARVAKREAKEAARRSRGVSFRERIDAAREKKKELGGGMALDNGEEAGQGVAKGSVKAGAKRKSAGGAAASSPAGAKRVKKT